MFGVACFGLMASSISSAQGGDGIIKLNKSFQRELIEMGKQDQRYRYQLTELGGKLSEPDETRSTEEFSELLKKQDKIDQENIKRLEELIAHYGWPTISLVGKEGSKAAFLIIQHADFSYQKKYFSSIKEAASRNEALPADAAMMEDRILVREGKKQIYGTQLFSDAAHGWQLYPIEDEENVDSRRARVGLTPMAENLKRFGLEYKPPRKKENDASSKEFVGEKQPRMP